MIRQINHTADERSTEQDVGRHLASWNPLPLHAASRREATAPGRRAVRLS